MDPGRRANGRRMLPRRARADRGSREGDGSRIACKPPIIRAAGSGESVAMENFSIGGFAWRIAFALALVLLTFNPAGWSYFRWIRGNFPAFTPAQAVLGIGLLVLMAAFTAALVWLFVSWGWLDIGNATTMAWVVLVSLGLILGVGMSWAIVRRELTGQASVDEIDDNN
jgi:hypothetical protein